MGHRVQVQSGMDNVVLPNGGIYTDGDIVDLSDADFSRLESGIFTSVLTDLGVAVPDPSTYLPPAQGYTTHTIANYNGSGKSLIMVAPADHAANGMVAMNDGASTWPMLVWTSAHGWSLGDGTSDPTTQTSLNHGLLQSSGNLGITSGGTLAITATAATANCDLTFAAAKGVVLTAPDTTKHRLKVANDGTLSTEVVA